MHNRENALTQWTEEMLLGKSFTLKPLAGDASFRRYYRLHYDDTSRIVMDAPPEKEPMDAFMHVGNILKAQNLTVPSIHALNKDEGFALLDDFGDVLLLGQLNPENADRLYKLAIDKLILLQGGCVKNIPDFDKQAILKELQLFKEWFLQQYLKIQLNPQEEELLEQSLTHLTKELEKQPKTLMHRDYHSRNLMLISNETDLGIIDFQDASYGPFTYDLVSLLKDCYIQWPQEQVQQWLLYFYNNSSLAQQWSHANFIRAFDLCGLQRHLKVLGIFSRLFLRDNKPNYLKDLPLILHYVLACLESYEELHPLFNFMQRIQLP